MGAGTEPAGGGALGHTPTPRTQPSQGKCNSQPHDHNEEGEKSKIKNTVVWLWWKYPVTHAEASHDSVWCVCVCYVKLHSMYFSFLERERDGCVGDKGPELN